MEPTKLSRKHLPLPAGPNTVGCVDIMTEYSKNGVFFRLYYPTRYNDVVERYMQWPPWLPHKRYLDGYAFYLGYSNIAMRKVYKWKIGHPYIPALWNAPLMSVISPLPVIIFSHGEGCCRTSYSTFCADLASHGFVVAAVEHRDRSACMTYHFQEIGCDLNASIISEDTEDIGVAALKKHWVSFRRIDPEKEDEIGVRREQLRIRVEECRKTYEVLKNLTEGRHVLNIVDDKFNTFQFRHTLDMNRVAVIGHSFGGTTVINTLADDSRFRTGILLDPWMIPLQEIKDIPPKVIQPLEFINSEYYQWKENVSLMYELKDLKTDIERKLYTIRGTKHMNQSDSPFLMGVFSGRFFKSRSWMDPLVARDLNLAAVLIFLWKHLDIPPDPSYEAYLRSKIQIGYVLEGTNIKL